MSMFKGEIHCRRRANDFFQNEQTDEKLEGCYAICTACHGYSMGKLSIVRGHPSRLVYTGLHTVHIYTEKR